MKIIKVLFILGSFDIGGVQSGIINFAKIVPENVKIDVLVHTDKIGFLEEEFKKYGNVFHIPILKTCKKNKLFDFIIKIINNYQFRYKLSDFLKNNKYDVVHSKSLPYSASSVEAAKINNVPVRIAQSHVDIPEKLNFLYKIYYKWCAKRIEKNATCKLAVSEKAVDLMFPGYKAQVIKNPTISLKKFNPNNYKNIKHDSINLIQIGTFSNRKNQCFSINILNELLKLNIDAKLFIVGYPLENSNYNEEIYKLVNDLSLSDKVQFLPKDSDIPKLLSESDYMLLPSLREGLPNVALESQAMGVPVFLSDTIFKDTDCGLCEFLSLEKGPKFWAEKILEYRDINGTEKKFVDMSMWDNETVVEEYLKIWYGEK